VAGHGAAADGLSVLACGGLAGYRQSLFGIAAAPKEGKGSVDPAAAARVIEREQGRLPMADILRCKCRYLTQGYIIGCSEFVREVSKPLEAYRKRPIRPKPVEGAAWDGLNIFPGMHG
ncbi:MAG: hypothetical protein ACLFSZ_04520, partial [Puniceicoccaceae bacterium]